MKSFTVVKTTHRNNSAIEITGTIAELVFAFKYTLDCGDHYSYEKGNKKINKSPKTIKSLITNLNNAVDNAARNGYGGVTYSVKD